MRRTTHEFHEAIDFPELPFGVGKPVGPLDLVVPPEILVCPHCLEEDKVPTPEMIHEVREAPPVVAFTYTDNHLQVLTGFEAAIRAIRAGRKEIGIIAFNVPTLEEGLLRAVRYELPLRGRSAVEVLELFGQYLNEARLQPRSVELYSRLEGMEFDVAPFEALLNLDGEVIKFVRSGELSESAAVCIAGIKSHEEQWRLAKYVIANSVSFDRLQDSILDMYKLDRCYDCTRRVWAAIPEKFGRLTEKFDYPKHPELENQGPGKGGGGK